MEYQKDITQKDIPQDDKNPGGIGQTAKRESISFVIRRTEKLTSALYLVSDIMSEREPLKWKVREIAVDLLSDVTLLQTASGSEKITVLRGAVKKAEKVIAFIDVAETTKLVSEMNASVLRREYSHIKDALESEWSAVYEKNKSMLRDVFPDTERPLLSASELARENSAPRPSAPVFTPAQTPAPRPPAIPAREERPIAPSLPQRNDVPKIHPQREFVKESPSAPSSQKGELARALEVAGINNSVFKNERERAPEERLAPYGSAPKQAEKITPHRAPSHEVHPDGFGRARSDGDKEERRKIILALIRQKPSLTVKDIAKSISGVSEKTIQRELLSMVAEGVLEKRGERRWSTYSIRQ